MAEPLPFLGGMVVCFYQWCLEEAASRARLRGRADGWLFDCLGPSRAILARAAVRFSCALLQALSRLPPTDKQARH